MNELRRLATRRFGPLPWYGGVPPLPFWVALAAVLIGWFPCDTLSTTIGAVRLHFHFFDVAALIARPARLVTGVNRGDALTVPFGILCLAVLAATLAPHLSGHRWARLGPVLPIVLMIICGALLYGVTSGDAFTAKSDAGSIGDALTKFGNTLAARASSVVAHRVSIGIGVWFSLPGAAYLARSALRSDIECGGAAGRDRFGGGLQR